MKKSLIYYIINITKKKKKMSYKVKLYTSLYENQLKTHRDTLSYVVKNSRVNLVIRTIIRVTEHV